MTPHTYSKYSHPQGKFHISVITVCFSENVRVEAALLIVESVQAPPVLQVERTCVGDRGVDG